MEGHSKIHVCSQICRSTLALEWCRRTKTIDVFHNLRRCCPNLFHKKSKFSAQEMTVVPTEFEAWRRTARSIALKSCHICMRSRVANWLTATWSNQNENRENILACSLKCELAASHVSSMRDDLQVVLGLSVPRARLFHYPTTCW